MADFLLEHYRREAERLAEENRRLREVLSPYRFGEPEPVPTLKLDDRRMVLGAVVRVTNESAAWRWRIDAEAMNEDGSRLSYGVMIDQAVLFEADPARYLEELLRHSLRAIAVAHAREVQTNRSALRKE